MNGTEADAASLRMAIVPVTPFQQNCSLLWNGATGVGAVVDPGGDLERILAEVSRHGISIEKILITHAHIDHAGGTAELARRLAVPIEGPQREDQFWIDKLPDQGRMFGIPPSEVFEPQRWLEHGDTVTVGGLELQVLHCPGHTPGHVSVQITSAAYTVSSERGGMGAGGAAPLNSARRSKRDTGTEF